MGFSTYKSPCIAGKHWIHVLWSSLSLSVCAGTGRQCKSHTYPTSGRLGVHSVPSLWTQRNRPSNSSLADDPPPPPLYCHHHHHNNDTPYCTLGKSCFSCHIIQKSFLLPYSLHFLHQISFINQLSFNKHTKAKPSAKRIDIIVGCGFTFYTSPGHPILYTSWQLTIYHITKLQTHVA